MNLMESGRAYPKLAVIVAAVALALGSQAQEPRENANRPDESTRIARSDAGMQTLDQYLQSNTLRVSKLVGMEVQTRSGENLAEVEDVIRGATPGQDIELVVQTAGGAGADGKLVAISFDDIQINADGDELYTTRTREELAAAVAHFKDAALKVPEDRYGEGKTVNKIFEGAGIEHFTEHAQQVREAAQRGDLDRHQ